MFLTRKTPYLSKNSGRSLDSNLEKEEGPCILNEETRNAWAAFYEGIYKQGQVSL